VADAEEAVRAKLSEQVAIAAPVLGRACETLGDLDALCARAQFAQRYACVVPTVGHGSQVTFRDARYLPLAETLVRHARGYAPLSLELAGVGVVTGPNMGGKTAALRTLGFLAACVAYGLPVPASDATLPLFARVAWVGIGSHADDDDGLLSAFGAEVVALRTFLERGERGALVLVDEFARTTSPREGRALLIALLETLRGRDASGLAATHLAGIAHAIDVPHFTSGALRALDPHDGPPLDLDVALRRIARAMDYRLERVDEDAVPAADALALADALGLGTEVIARAKAALA
jgi:dsDNA-specific endonuclease/ATPase MutS2